MPTKIEWCDESWNPVTGCTPISEGCKNCYAKKFAYRFRGRFGYPKDNPFTPCTIHMDKFKKLSTWTRKPRRIFVCSMGDLFHKVVHTKIIHDILHAICLHKMHTFMMLTKRPYRMKQEIISWMRKTNEYYDTPIPNLWIGVTAENQKRAEERIPILMGTPAVVRFVSIEPMLEPIDLWPFGTLPEKNNKVFELLDWVICGKENGPGARPFKKEWAISLRNQCKIAKVPFFYKSGTLQGKTYNQFPKGYKK